MEKVKKVIVFMLSVLLIVVFANCTFAASIQPKNDVGNTNNTINNTNDNTSNNSSNNTSSINSINNTSNSLVGTTNNTTKINTTNASENLPEAGVEDTYLNFALIVLLALVLGMFSIVQYNKIAKKENE